jgi:uncharacterized protein YegL
MNEPSLAHSKVKCLPTYVLIDTSGSMKPSEDALNETLEHLYNELFESPRISEFAHISIISFNNEAHVILPMTDIQQVTALPQLGCSGVTDFGKVFRRLRACIEDDVPALNRAGRAVLRPLAFLLTDGQPTDATGRATQAWRPDYQALVDHNWRRRPNIVTFGFGNATADVLSDIATKQGAAFLAQDRGKANEALKRIFVTVLNTLVASARENELRIPAEVDGFIRVSPEFVD